MFVGANSIFVTGASGYLGVTEGTRKPSKINELVWSLERVAYERAIRVPWPSVVWGK